ncbi:MULTISPECIES: LuxR C-terminal-related transcriptional regulator [unclassified Ornithinimicrobium]|uniref:helix-turn-helix transcriptional regulator n=1 Tax=unclassified Ornithinimicrobium TaxID=2615080 RepID=UPI0038531168
MTTRPATPLPATHRRVRGEAYEEFIRSVYLLAIGLGAPTRAGLRVDLDDEDVTDAMSELVARGMLLPTGDPDAWVVVPPREAMTRHADRLEQRVSMERATAVELDASWRRAAGLSGSQLSPDLDVLGGVGEIVDRIRSLHRTATARLWWAMDTSAATVEMLGRLEWDVDELAVRPGVDVRLVFDTSLLEQPGALRHLERSAALGHGVRVGRGVPLGVLVSDDRAVLLDLSAFDRQGDGSVESRRLSQVRAGARLLEEIWQLSTPFAPTMEAAHRAPGDQAPLEARDHRILALLTTGLSDQIIARQTGVSVRTVERRVRYLMEHLGAATRFQAGVQAARRGWV